MYDSTVPDSTHIIIVTALPRFFEVVVQRGVEYAELGVWVISSARIGGGNGKSKERYY